MREVFGSVVTGKSKPRVSSTAIWARVSGVSGQKRPGEQLTAICLFPASTIHAAEPVVVQETSRNGDAEHSGGW